MLDPRDLSNKSDDEAQQNRYGKRSSSSMRSLRSFASDTPNQNEKQRDVAPPPEPRTLSFSEQLTTDAGCGFLLIGVYAVSFISVVILREMQPLINPTLLSVGMFVVLPVIMLSLWFFYHRQNHFTPNPAYLTDLDPREAEEHPRAAQRVYEPAKPHALEATRAAGLDPDTILPAQPIDIGVIAFWGENTVHAHRTVPVPISADSLQPYIELELRQDGHWQVEFEILDGSDQTLFQHAIDFDLPLSQRVLLTPPARLSQHIAAQDDTWTLRVRVNGTLVANHSFTWRSDNIDSLEGNIDSDGEIDESILPLLANNYAQPMSLNDLLAHGDDKLNAKEADVE